MYKANEIKTAWAGLIGWRQNPGHLKIYESLTQSESGLFFQDEHPLVNLLQLQKIAPKDENQYFNWNSTTEYLEGALVHKGNVHYIALQGTEAEPNVGNDPAAEDSEFWAVYQWFSYWLKNLTEAAFIQVVQDFLEQKQLNQTAKSIFEERPIFDRPIYRKLNETNRGELIGWRFVQAPDMGILTKLNRVSLCFSEAQNITLKLYTIGKTAAVQTISLNYTTPGEIQWFNLNWELYFHGQDLNGSFYVEFDETQISGYPISQEAEWLLGDTRYNEDYYFVPWAKFLQVHPYRLNQRAEANPTDFQYEYTRTLGLNFEISMFCDYTSFLIRQKDIFKNAISKRVAMNVLREIAYNANERINGTEAALSRERILYEIDGDTQGRDTGLSGKYYQALKAAKMNTSGLQAICLPCEKKGVKIRAK